MKLQTIFLDASPVRNEIIDDISNQRTQLIHDSIRSFQGEGCFLVSNLNRSNLIQSGMIDAAIEVRVVTPFGPTRGALASALLPIDLLSDSEPVLVLPTNSVTRVDVLKSFVEKMYTDGVAAGIILVESKNPHFSYARIHEGKVIEIIEKSIVGNLATTGVFYFRNKHVLKESARWAFVNNQSTQNTFYIAQSLNYVLSAGEDIGYVIVDSSNYQHFAW